MNKVSTLGVGSWAALGVPAALDAVKSAGAAHLWDVREHTTMPGGQWSEWAEKNLRAACQAAGVEYIRRGVLGVPSSLRDQLTAPGVTHEQRLAAYASHLRARGVELGTLRDELTAQGGAAFLCACKSDGRPCHRFLLAELLGVQVLDVTP